MLDKVEQVDLEVGDHTGRRPAAVAATAATTASVAAAGAATASGAAAGATTASVAAAFAAATSAAGRVATPREVVEPELVVDVTVVRAY